jgi:hypothetical protein
MAKSLNKGEKLKSILADIKKIRTDIKKIKVGIKILVAKQTLLVGQLSKSTVKKSNQKILKRPARATPNLGGKSAALKKPDVAAIGKKPVLVKGSDVPEAVSR